MPGTPETDSLRTLPGDDIRQVMWRFTDKFTHQMLVQSSRGVARGLVARLVAGGVRETHEWTPEKASLLQAFDEAGNPHGPLIGILTDQHSLELEASDFAGGLSFGSLHFNFTNSSGGVAYSEAQAGGRFSVGMTGQCHEAP